MKKVSFAYEFAYNKNQTKHKNNTQCPEIRNNSVEKYKTAEILLLSKLKFWV